MRTITMFFALAMLAAAADAPKTPVIPATDKLRIADAQIAFKDAQATFFRKQTSINEQATQQAIISDEYKAMNAKLEAYQALVKATATAHSIDMQTCSYNETSRDFTCPPAPTATAQAKTPAVAKETKQ